MAKQLPDLTKSLQPQDVGYLRIVAAGWGIDLPVADARETAAGLVARLQDHVLVSAGLQELPPEALQALQALRAQEGRITWVQFTRLYGELREMGAGRRDRQRPDLSPISTTEVLWYRALIARAFFDTSQGPQEFAYLPEDFYNQLPPAEEEKALILGRAARPEERSNPVTADDRILDDACTVLAAQRLGLPEETVPFSPLPPCASPLSVPTLRVLLSVAGLLDSQGIPQAEASRSFLEARRAEALSQLVFSWRESREFNELRLIPGLDFEGEWVNDPHQARRTILEYLSALPAGTWWNLDSFVAGVKQQAPDFQRPAGDYDSWFIRSKQSGEYLRGFSHWEAVDGALVKFLVCGPLHWLGLADLAGEALARAFRLTQGASALLDGEPGIHSVLENGKLHAGSDARLSLPRRLPRAARYQIARLCSWEGMLQESRDSWSYRYRITAASLEQAREQGLRASHLLALLRRHAQSVPPALARALERWEERGAEARLEQATVLRLKSPELLQELRASRVARFLGDPLGPVAVIVKPGAWEKVQRFLAEQGFLVDERL